MGYASKEFSNDFAENPRSTLQSSPQEEGREEQLARSLLVLERQRRIAERLAAFERDMQERAERVIGGITA